MSDLPNILSRQTKRLKSGRFNQILTDVNTITRVRQTQGVVCWDDLWGMIESLWVCERPCWAMVPEAWLWMLVNYHRDQPFAEMPTLVYGIPVLEHTEKDVGEVGDVVLFDADHEGPSRLISTPYSMQSPYVILGEAQYVPTI